MRRYLSSSHLFNREPSQGVSEYSGTEARQILRDDPVPNATTRAT
jgi:hypothetical protein